MTVPFTFPMTYAGALIAECDGYAVVGPDGIEEVYLEELITHTPVLIGGELAELIERYLDETIMRPAIEEAIAEVKRGQIGHAREIARGA